MRKVVRWTARLWSIASVGLILFFIVGEGVKIARPSEWLLFLFFPIGISAGMILAWWKEEIGGSIAVGSLLLFYMIHFASARRVINQIVPATVTVLCKFRVSGSSSQ